MDDQTETAMLAAGEAVATTFEPEPIVVVDVLILVSYSDSDGVMSLCWQRLDSTSSWGALGMASAYCASQTVEQTAIRVVQELGED